MTGSQPNQSVRAISQWSMRAGQWEHLSSHLRGAEELLKLKFCKRLCSSFPSTRKCDRICHQIWWLCNHSCPSQKTNPRCQITWKNVILRTKWTSSVFLCLIFVYMTPSFKICPSEDRQVENTLFSRVIWSCLLPSHTECSSHHCSL